MKLRILFFLVFLSLVLRLDASMVRVLDVTGGRTLIVEKNGAPLEVQLAGIEITDGVGAQALMHWTLLSAWVMLDAQPEGGYFVYRSPDGQFVNRELVARGMARALVPTIEPTSHVVVTYLGTIDPDPSGARRRGAAVRAASNTASARGTGSGATGPAPAKPSRSRRRSKP
jgi:endonuclease YncB( thermonuclease family)